MKQGLRRALAAVAALLGLGSVGVGIAFLVIGATNNATLTEAMREENITLGIEQTAIAEGQVIDTMSEAMAAGDTIREHRRGIAVTYSDLLGEGRFDPTNPEHLTYAQALNLESYLYLAVLGFGLTQVATVSGIVMIAVGIALVLLAFLAFRPERWGAAENPALS